MRTRLRASLTAAVILLPSIALLAQNAQVAQTPNAVAQGGPAAATVNGQPIAEFDVQRGLEKIPPQQRTEARLELVNFLIDNVLVEQYLLQMRVAVEEKAVAKRVEEMRAEAKKNKQDFDKMLEQMKLGAAELQKHVTADLRWENFVGTQVDDAKLKAFFEANKDLFDGGMVHARHILLTPPVGDTKAGTEAVAKLRDIRAKVDAAVVAGLAKLPADADNLAKEKARTNLMEEAFAAHAKASSNCPTKDKGGDVGWFQRAGVMVEPFSRAAFACKPYQMTDVVQTPFGFHLILVTERKAGREVKFEEVKDIVKDVYGDKLRESVIAMMRQRAKIEITPAKP